MGAVMDGEATPAQLAALLMGLRMRGETVDELAGFATAMRERVRPGRRARRRDRRRRHRRRRQRHVQHLDDRGARRRRRRACRSPSTATARSRRGRARPTCSTRSGVRIDHDAASAGGGAPRARLRVPVRAELPPGDAPRRPDPARDRRAHRVQPARPADQPGRHAPAAARGRRRGGRAADGRGRRAGSGTERTFVDPRRRRRRAAARRQRRGLRSSPATAIERHVIDAVGARLQARRDRAAGRRRRPRRTRG